MLYPSIYNNREVDRNKVGPLVYEGGITLGLGDATEEMLMKLNDETADKYAADSNMKIITKAEADTWLAAARSLVNVPEERVTDVDRMVAISAKVAAGVTLTREDEDALDPDKPVRGITRQRKTADGIFGVG